MYSTITCGIRETPIYAKLIGRGVIYPKVAVIYLAILQIIWTSSDQRQHEALAYTT